MFGIMAENSKIGQPLSEWVDNIDRLLVPN